MCRVHVDTRGARNGVLFDLRGSVLKGPRKVMNIAAIERTPPDGIQAVTFHEKMIE